MCVCVPLYYCGPGGTLCVHTTVGWCGTVLLRVLGPASGVCYSTGRLQEFVIAQAQSSLNCAQGPQSLAGGVWPLAAVPYIFLLCASVCVSVCVRVHECVYACVLSRESGGRNIQRIPAH